MTDEFKPEDLDPGIRSLVLYLREKGWDTTDSGDGVSKPKDWYESGDAMPFAHVAITLKDEMDIDSLREANIVDLGQKLFNDVEAFEADKWTVECTYDPRARMMLALVRELTDQEKEAIQEARKTGKYLLTNSQN